MAVTIQVRRGSKAGLPSLATGEYGLATDTSELFIGGESQNLQIPVLSAGAVPISQGGTGATSASSALTNLGALPTAGGTLTGPVIAQNGDISVAQIRNIYAGTSELTSGSSPLDTGTIYLMYE